MRLHEGEEFSNEDFRSKERFAKNKANDLFLNISPSEKREKKINKLIMKITFQSGNLSPRIGFRSCPNPEVQCI